jgi:hypothetical protein
MRRILVLLLLAACTPVTVAEDLPTITVSSGFQVQSTTTIRADDRVEEHFVGLGRPDTQRVVPGVYARAGAVIAAEGPDTKAHVKPVATICMDYGTDLVRANPPIAGFDSVAVNCPDDAVNALMAAVLAAVAAPQ